MNKEMHLLNKVFCTAILFLLVMISSMSGEIVSISLKGNILFPMADSFDGPPVDALNMILDDMSSLFGRSDILKVSTGTLDRLDSLSGLGGEFDFHIKKRISLSLGIEFSRTSTKGNFLAESLIPDAPYTYQRNFIMKMTTVPVLATFRYHFFLGNLDIHTGVGLGYYRVSLEGTSNYRDIQEEGEDLYWKAAGGGFMPHLQCGVSLRIIKGIALGISLDYTIGKINEFEVRDSKTQALIGKPLEFTPPTGPSFKYEQNRQGLRASFTLKYIF